MSTKLCRPHRPLQAAPGRGVPRPGYRRAWQPRGFRQLQRLRLATVLHVQIDQLEAGTWVPGPCRAGLLQPLSGLVVATASLSGRRARTAHPHRCANTAGCLRGGFASASKSPSATSESCKIEAGSAEAGLNLERLAVGLARAGRSPTPPRITPKEVEDHRIPGFAARELLGDLSRFDPLAVPEIERRQRKAYRGIARALRKTGLQGGQPRSDCPPPSWA